MAKKGNRNNWGRERYKEIKSLSDLTHKTGRKYTIEDVTKGTWESISKLDKDSLYKLAERATNDANSRRKIALEAIVRHNMPLPPSYRNWAKLKDKEGKEEKAYFEAGDSFSVKNVKEISGIENYITDDYSRGFATVDFSINEDMSRNELMHKIMLASAFLDNETSTKGGWEKELQRIATRVKQKSGFKITTKEEYAKFWELYNIIHGSKSYNEMQKVYFSGDSASDQKKTYQIMEQGRGLSLDRLVELARQEGEIDYERLQEQDESGNDFYTIDGDSEENYF